MNNPVVYFLNSQGVILFILGILAFLFITEKKKEVFNHTLLVVVITLFVCIVLKELFNTPRPFMVDKIRPEAGMSFFPSFPSAHAALSFSVATIVAIHRRRLGIFLLVIASLISVGRVAAHVHYPVDIAFGTLLGVTIAMFFDQFHIKRLAKRKRST